MKKELLLSSCYRKWYKDSRYVTFLDHLAMKWQSHIWGKYGNTLKSVS